MYSFAGLIRRTPPPTFSDTAITEHHSDTTIYQLRAYWVGISWSIGSEKSFGRAPGGSQLLVLNYYHYILKVNSGLFHCYILAEFICHFRGVGSTDIL